MLKFLADENLDGRILSHINRIEPRMDIVRARDVGLFGVSDPELLEWSAAESRIVLSHDKKTLVPAARERVQTNLSMPGLFIVKHRVSIRALAEEIVILAMCSSPGEWEGQIQYLPML
jgi:hypothetical protein